MFLCRLVVNFQKKIIQIKRKFDLSIVIRRLIIVGGFCVLLEIILSILLAILHLQRVRSCKKYPVDMNSFKINPA